MPIKILTVVLAVSLLLFVVELVRREQLTFKYAFGWILIAGAAIFLAVFDNILTKLAKTFGFELASNFIFFTLLSIFVFLTLVMTIFLCQQNNRNDKMAQKIGALEFELQELKKKLTGSAQKGK